MPATIIDMAALTRLMANRFSALTIADCDITLPHEEADTRDTAQPAPGSESPATAQMLDPVFAGQTIDASGEGSAEAGAVFRCNIQSAAESAAGQSPYLLHQIASRIIAGMTASDAAGDGHVLRWSGGWLCRPEPDPELPQLRALVLEINALCSRASGDSMVAVT